jgi:hypothetical protein
MNRFPVFDHERKSGVEVIDGVPTIINDRDVVEEHCIIEPSDERVDFFASIPVRSVITAGCGPAIEIGPFTLDDNDIVKLYNALSAHINNFPGEFKIRREA